MKKIIYSLYFFLLISQYCFGQWYQQISIIDTAIIFRMGDNIADPGDTTRHLYTFNYSAAMTSDITQKFHNENWLNTHRHTIIYDGNKKLTDLFELWNLDHWVSDRRTNYTYNEAGYLISWVSETWDSLQWNIRSSYTCTFDAVGNKLLEVYTYGNWLNTIIYDGFENILVNMTQYLVNGQLTNDSRFIMSYDTDGNMIANLSQRGNGQLWIDSDRSTFTYDNVGNRLSELHEVMHDIYGWCPIHRWTYTYDEIGNRLSEVMEWRDPWWPANNWEFSTKNTYTYNPENRILSELLEMWTSNSWEFFRHKIYTYDTMGNIISETWEDWINNQWFPNRRYLHSYDASGNKLFELCEVGVVNQWVNDWRWSYSYDTNGELVSIWHHNWVNSSWIPTNGCNVYDKLGDCAGYNLNDDAGNLYELLPGYNFTFKRSLLITGIFNDRVNIVETYSLSQNYPNPFNPNTVISYQLPVSGDVTLKVFDILGNEVATLVNEYKPAGKYEVEFNIYSDEGRNLSSGVYFYQLKAGEYVAVKKMILLK